MSTDPKLTDEEREYAKAFGISDAEYAANKSPAPAIVEGGDDE